MRPSTLVAEGGVLCSEYRRACAEYIERVRQRPGMFVSSLEDLESVLHGHGVAFEQMGEVESWSSTFNEAFGRWLASSVGLSCASGWGFSVQNLALEGRREPIAVFFQLFGQFCRESSGWESYGQGDS